MVTNGDSGKLIKCCLVSCQAFRLHFIWISKQCDCLIVSYPGCVCRSLTDKLYTGLRHRKLVVLYYKQWVTKAQPVAAAFQPSKLTSLLMQMGVSKPAAHKCHITHNRGFATENQNWEDTGVSPTCSLTPANHHDHLEVRQTQKHEHTNTQGLWGK